MRSTVTVRHAMDVQQRHASVTSTDSRVPWPSCQLPALNDSTSPRHSRLPETVFDLLIGPGLPFSCLRAPSKSRWPPLQIDSPILQL